jgi:hypothetical protein
MSIRGKIAGRLVVWATSAAARAHAAGARTLGRIDVWRSAKAARANAGGSGGGSSYTLTLGIDLLKLGTDQLVLGRH